MLTGVRLQCRHFTLLLIHSKVITQVQRYTRAVITAVFEFFQSIN